MLIYLAPAVAFTRMYKPGTLTPDTSMESNQSDNDGFYDADNTSDKINLEDVQFIQKVDDEQLEFNNLSTDFKMQRLDNLIKKSQVYSQIIANQILENTNLKKQNRQKQKDHNQEENERSNKKQKRDVLLLLSKQTSKTVNSKKHSKSQKDTKADNSVEDGVEKIKQPKLVKGGILKPYQLDGLEWLITLYENGLNGILADEMGLGKTIQCISFISFLIENGIKGSYLIVAPLSTITNWYNELARFTPDLKVLKYVGPKDERATKEFKGFDVVLTSYELSIKDFAKFTKTNWKFLIIDEGHRLKNMNCLLIRILKQLNVANRLLITGTPLQNSLDELWSLLNFILPDIFHDLHLFQQWFNFDEILNFSKQEGEVSNFIKKQLENNLIKNLHTILSPFILRRLKRDVISNLPPKKEYLLHIELTDYQKKLYNDALNNRLYEGVFELFFKDYKKFNNVKDENDNQLKDLITQIMKHSRLQNLIMQLRIICNSPYHFYEPFPIDKQLTSREVVWDSKKKETTFITELVKNSSKFKILDQLLNNLKGHKILIFSQFTKTLDLISDYLTYKLIKSCRFDGSTSQADRDKQIQLFKELDYKVFLLSTRSGGLGINLIEADTVILFDNDWNPQVDLQAIDRCHRIGQTRPVKIYRFLIRNSIEEILIMKNYSRRFLEKLVIQMGEVNFNKVFNYEIEFNNLVNLSKKFGFVGTKDEFHFDYDNINEITTLNEEEMNELMDRSDECYKVNRKFDNISIFETLNKLDDQ